MKKTLVKGLVALAAGALLAGGLLGCQQTVDSFTVKPSSLDSANVKAVHTPGFFALTWDRVKNCAGYDIEAKNVATGEIISFAQNLSVTKTDITVDDLWMTSDPDVKEWLQKNLSPEKDYRAEYEFTVIALSSSASGRAATAVGVQNSYSSVRVVFESVPDDYAKPAVPSDVEATLVYKPLVDGKKTTTGTLSGSFTAKAGVYYALVKDIDLPPLTVEDNKVVFNPMNAIEIVATPSIRDTKVNFEVEVDDVTPGAEYSYTLAALYMAYTESGNMLYNTKALKAPAVEDVDSGFKVTTNQGTTEKPVIHVKWNKAYGGSVEYVELATGVTYTPGMTGKEIYDLLVAANNNQKLEPLWYVDETEENGTIIKRGTIDNTTLDKDTRYVVVVLKKGDVYEMQTVTIKAVAEPPELAKFDGSYITVDLNSGTSDSNYGKVDIYVKLNNGVTVGDWKQEVSPSINYWVELISLDWYEMPGGYYAQFPVKVDESTIQSVSNKADVNATEYSSDGISISKLKDYASEIRASEGSENPTMDLVLTYGANRDRIFLTNNWSIK